MRVSPPGLLFFFHGALRPQKPSCQSCPLVDVHVSYTRVAMGGDMLALLPCGGDGGGGG